jgi:molybdenum cofactor cytidylyltransferase
VASPRVAAILLAAGASRRMGCCKQLLELGGKTALARCLDALLQGGVDQVIVVVAPDGDEVERAARRYPVRVVRNAGPAGDMATSIRTGRDALAPGTSGVLVALCDYPLVSSDTIATLVESHRRDPGSILIPCHLERRGHPPLIPRRLLDELAHPLTLRDLLRTHSQLIRQLELVDAGVLVDMDTPEDYRRVAAAALALLPDLPSLCARGR